MGEWEGTVRRTWFADRDTVSQVEDYVRARLVRSRGLDPGHHQPGVYSVERLVTDVERFGASREWFWTLVGMCLLAELILNAADGGTSLRKGAASADRTKKGWRHHEAFERTARDELLPLLAPVADLRNAVVHLAATKEGSRFVDGFLAWCEENREPRLAEQLLPPLRLASDPIARKQMVEEVMRGKRHAEWSQLASEPVARFALRRLDSAGRYLRAVVEGTS